MFNKEQGGLFSSEKMGIIMESQNLNTTNQNKKGFGKAAFLLIGLVIGIALTSILSYFLLMKNPKNTSEKLEGTGYDSPEKAVEAYVNYLKEGNLKGIISTFAVESYVDNYDMTEHYKYYQSFLPYGAGGEQMTSGLYFDSDMSRDLNIESSCYELHPEYYTKTFGVFICLNILLRKYINRLVILS